jgi:Family of unknown function (DUF5681)
MTRKNDVEKPNFPFTKGDEPAGATPPPDENVGYRRPPVSTRFKPGTSGNPSGKPKGSKSLNQLLRQALNRRVPDSRRGGRHRVSMIELIFEGIVLGAARREPPMVRILLALINQLAPTDVPASELEELRAGDREILNEFIASASATGGNSDGEQ